MIEDLEWQDEFISAVMRHRNEDADNQSLQKRIEKLIPRLREGRNYVNPKEYSDCVFYFLEDGEDIESAQDRGSFCILGRLTIQRVRWRDEAKMVTASELAKAAGKSKMQMLRLLNAAEIPFKLKGQKRLYDFDSLEKLRDSTGT